LSVALLAGVALAGCGSSSNSSTTASVVTTTVAAAPAPAASESTTPATATESSSATTAAATTAAAAVKPTKHSKAEVVQLCQVSIRLGAAVPASKKSALSALCGEAVEGSTAAKRKGAAEKICLGLVGATPATPEAARKLALKDCKTNSWD
jgi:hypothetical protein